ncbi:MAG TPA: hypothetical protein VF710_16690 [Longimicrobium sp.]|jgi:hypothetical protein
MRLPCILAFVVSLFAADAAHAQHCWPIEVRLEVRDPAGRRFSPVVLDSVVVVVARGSNEVPVRSRVEIPRDGTASDTSGTLQWLTAACRLRLQRATLYASGRALHLDFNIDINTFKRPGPSAFLIEAPPLQSATFRLRFGPEVRGGHSSAPRRLDASWWERVPAAKGAARPRSHARRQ